MLSNPLVSIIVCNYNKPVNLVKRCIESIIKQTYKNIILYYVDNGSTLDTLTKDDLNCYKDRIKIIDFFVKENVGVPGGYNVALKEIKSNLFTLIDSDDYVLENYVECMVNEMQKNDSDMVFVLNNHETKYGIVSAINDCKTTTLSSMELNKSILDFYHKYSNNIVAEDLGTHWGILFDRNKITINYFYPTENYKIGYYADFVYVTKILNNVSKVTVIGEPLYILNRSGDSVTSSISKTFSFETIDSIHHIEKNITIWDEETNNAFVRKVISLFMVVFSTCNVSV